MIRPPSLSKPYEDHFSKDPAFVQLADDATEDEVREHVRKWRTARETGDFSALRVSGGGEPTVFTLRPLGLEAFAALVDMTRSGSGHNEVAVLAFRIALRGVSNFGKADIKFVHHKRFGQIATTEFLDKSGLPAGVTLAIATELGGAAIERASQLSPLS
jgi:hypothetical protein